jgi:CO/xanthine dehydrogenase Mo-binding subunit
VEGLAIGSTASGIGGALYEEFLFDQEENNLTLTFGDYMKPTAMEIPEIRLEMHESPAPNTVLGTKAVGEGGAITSLGAVASAVENALEPFNVRISSLPITPENIWKMIRDTDEYRKLKGVN